MEKTKLFFEKIFQKTIDKEIRWSYHKGRSERGIRYTAVIKANDQNAVLMLYTDKLEIRLPYKEGEVSSPIRLPLEEKDVHRLYSAVVDSKKPSREVSDWIDNFLKTK